MNRWQAYATVGVFALTPPVPSPRDYRTTGTVTRQTVAVLGQSGRIA